MSKKQKIALIIFALVDVLIVAILITTITNSWSKYPASRYQSPASMCADNYLNALQSDFDQLTFAMENDTIYVTASVNNLDYQDDQDQTQLMWSLFDHLSPIAIETGEICLNPQTLVLQIDFISTSATTNHLVSIAYSDLIAWSQDQISEEAFASKIKYREISTPRD